MILRKENANRAWTMKNIARVSRPFKRNRLLTSANASDLTLNSQDECRILTWTCLFSISMARLTPPQHCNRRGFLIAAMGGVFCAHFLFYIQSVVRYVNIFTISVFLIATASCFPPCIFFLCNAALVTVHTWLTLYFLRAANRSVVFIWHVIQHRELYLSAPPAWKTCTARLYRHAHNNTLMYSALMNFLYSTENKPLYFPVICKVLKKIKYTHDASFLSSSQLWSCWIPEGTVFLWEAAQTFLVLLKVPATFYVINDPGTAATQDAAAVKFSHLSAAWKQNPWLIGPQWYLRSCGKVAMGIRQGRGTSFCINWPFVLAGLFAFIPVGVWNSRISVYKDFPHVHQTQVLLREVLCAACSTSPAPRHSWEPSRDHLTSRSKIRKC